MEFESYVRKPFEVEAIEVTTKNIEEIAPMIGTLQYSEDGAPFIAVDESKIPNVPKVWPGYWVTKVGNKNIRCYTNKLFFSLFIENTEEIDAWVRFINNKPAKSMPMPTVPAEAS